MAGARTSSIHRIRRTRPPAAPVRAGGSRRSAVIRRRGAPGAQVAIDAAALFVAALLLRLVQLDHTPHMDELFHVFAARSLLEDGTLSIAGGGEYTRASGFTRIVAATFRAFGESLVVARLPAVFAGSALVALLYLWVRGSAGRLAGWIAAGLLCLYPGSLYLSQLARFYTAHALLFLLGTVAVWKAVEEAPLRWPRAAVLGVAAAACYLAALHLQVTTLLGVAAVSLAALVVSAPRLVAELRRSRRARVAALLAAGGVAVLGALAFDPGRVERIVGMYRFADLWARDAVSEVQFYHYQLLLDYPAIWVIFPFVVLLGATVAPRFVLFAATAFGVVFLGHSFAAWKSARYLYYGMPFFFALAGVGIAAAWPRLVAVVDEGLRRMLGPGGLAPDRVDPGRLAASPSRATATLVAAGVVAFAAAAGGAFRLTWRMLSVPDAAWAAPIQYRGESDWRGAAPLLAPALAAADVVVSSADLKPLYYLGRLDLVLSATELVRDASGALPEFSPTAYTGRPILSTAPSLAYVMACAPSGVVVVERAHWRRDWAVSPEVADYLEARAERIELPAGLRLHAFRWERPVAARPAAPGGGAPGGAESPASCADVPWRAPRDARITAAGR